MLTYTVGRQQAASKDFELWLPKQLVAGSHRYSGLHFGRFLGHALVHFVFFCLSRQSFLSPCILSGNVVRAKILQQTVGITGLPWVTFEDLNHLACNSDYTRRVPGRKPTKC